MRERRPPAPMARAPATDVAAGGAAAVGVAPMARSMAASRSAAYTGLVRCAATPSAAQRACSPLSPDELSIMTVTPPSSGCPESSAATSNPSISGMLASSRTSSNGRAVSAAAMSASMAARPLATAVAVIPQRLNCSASTRRLTSLSSTMSTSRCRGRGPAGAASGASVTSRVTVKWNVLPAPASLSTQIRPPISRTSVAEIVRPRPVPPNRRVVDPSA